LDNSVLDGCYNTSESSNTVPIPYVGALVDTLSKLFLLIHVVPILLLVFPVGLLVSSAECSFLNSEPSQSRRLRSGRPGLGHLRVGHRALRWSQSSNGGEFRCRRGNERDSLCVRTEGRSGSE
jgi:hypothetical protein